MKCNTSVNKMLGYPDDARLLILNCDDFGVCHAENEGTLQALTKGVCSSTTVMTPCPWALVALEAVKKNHIVNVGVHLTLVCEYPYYKWKPLSPQNKVRTLTDRDGYTVSPLDGEAIKRFNVSEAEIEFRAQIEMVFASGIQPTHIDSHWHVHEIRQDLFDLTVRLAQEYGIALRAGFVDESVKKVRALGLPCSDKVSGVGKVKDEDKCDEYIRMLRELKVGLTEWAIHVGVDTPEIRELMTFDKEQFNIWSSKLSAQEKHIYGYDDLGTWLGRKADLETFTSDAIKEVIRKEGIIVIGYKELQEFWKNN